MKIRLFTSSHTEKDKKRAEELGESLRRNVANPEIDEICLLVEGDRGSTRPESQKVLTRTIPRRPRYEDFFDWIGDVAHGTDVSIIANSDIYFDEQLAIYRTWRPANKVALCLSRWEAAQNEPQLNDRNDSQDAWVFFDKVDSVAADFPIGVPRCDNRLAHELEAAGYRVINPAFSLRSYHLHSGQRQEYSVENRDRFVEPPYKYIWPHNLWSLPRTIAYNIQHPRSRVLWRLDRREVSRKLKLHWVTKVYHALQR